MKKKSLQNAGFFIKNIVLFQRTDAVVDAITVQAELCIDLLLAAMFYKLIW